MVGATWTTVCQTVRTLGVVQGDGVVQIPDDRLYIVIPLTPWIERRKSIGMRKSLIIDNYLTGIRISQPPAAARWAERDLSAGVLNRLQDCTVDVAELETGWQQALTLAAELAAALSLDGRAELSSAFSPAPAPSPPFSDG